MQETASSYYVDNARDMLARTRDGRHVSTYISSDRLAGRSHEQFWIDKVETCVATADALFALPVPRPGRLTRQLAHALAEWLEGGVETARYRGFSTCRICKCSNGSSEMERDGYRYPRGLIHYVRDHLVSVPGLPLIDPATTTPLV